MGRHFTLSLTKAIAYNSNPIALINLESCSGWDTQKCRGAVQLDHDRLFATAHDDATTCSNNIAKEQDSATTNTIARYVYVCNQSGQEKYKKCYGKWTARLYYSRQTSAEAKRAERRNKSNARMNNLGKSRTMTPMDIPDVNHGSQADYRTPIGQGGTALHYYYKNTARRNVHLCYFHGTPACQLVILKMFTYFQACQ